MNTLVLFDIDGTLLLTGGAGRRAMAWAAADLFGRPDLFDGRSFAGAVDPQIAAAALGAGGIEPTPRRLGRFKATYLRRLRRTLRTARGGALPGAARAVGAVAARGAQVGLLTGNWREGARLKLARFGLWPLVARAPGAFGDDAARRDDLVPVAVRRARRRAGRPVRRVLLVGDTPADVRAARAAAAVLPDVQFVSVAVASGVCDAASLRAAAPDLLAADLERGLDAILELLG